MLTQALGRSSLKAIILKGRVMVHSPIELEHLVMTKISMNLWWGGSRATQVS